MKAKTTVRGSSMSKAQSANGVKRGNGKPVVFDMSLFISGVAGYLRSLPNSPIPFDGEYSEQPALKEAIEMFEIEKAAEVENYGDAVTALANFKEWLDNTDWVYTPPTKYMLQNLTVTLGMNTPSGTLQVSMSAILMEATVAEAVRAMKDELQEALKQAFAGPFARTKPLPETSNSNGKLAKRSKSDEEQPEYETEEAHIVGLRVKKYEGKWYYNAIPNEGKWTQYGIPLYKDIAKKFGIELPEESGEYDVDWLCVYELKDDGKPRRVVDIDEANSGDD